MNVFLLLVALHGTHPTVQGCSLAIGPPEQPMFQWLVRRRPVTSAVWQDTLRCTPRAGEGPGQPITLPLLMPLHGIWVFQVAGVDSAGNIGCWSPSLVRAR